MGLGSLALLFTDWDAPSIPQGGSLCGQWGAGPGPGRAAPGDSPGLRVSMYTCVKKHRTKCKNCNQDLCVNDNHRPFHWFVRVCGGQWAGALLCGLTAARGTCPGCMVVGPGVSFTANGICGNILPLPLKVFKE